METSTSRKASRVSSEERSIVYPLEVSDSLPPPGRQGPHDCGIVRVEAVLPGPEVERPHGKAVAHPKDLRLRQLVDPIDVAITVGTNQVARIGEAYPDAELHGSPR